MTGDRKQVFDRVRAALAAPTGTTPRERTLMPVYRDDLAFRSGVAEGEDPVVTFVDRLSAAGGRAFADATALGRWLVERGVTLGYCDPVLVPVLGPAWASGLSLETTFTRDRVDAYEFGITRAAGAIAETGTLILDDRVTSRRLAAIAPWIHVAVVARAAIHYRIIDAIRALATETNVVWCTGPSKTADVEGILIEGVHGPGEQVALVVG